MSSLGREIAERLRRDGWTKIGMTGGKHARWTHPSGATLTAPSTPSDHRAVANCLGDARRRVRAALDATRSDKVLTAAPAER